MGWLQLAVACCGLLPATSGWPDLAVGGSGRAAAIQGGRELVDEAQQLQLYTMVEDKADCKAVASL